MKNNKRGKAKQRMTRDRSHSRNSHDATSIRLTSIVFVMPLRFPLEDGNSETTWCCVPSANKRSIAPSRRLRYCSSSCSLNMPSCFSLAIIRFRLSPLLLPRPGLDSFLWPPNGLLQQSHGLGLCRSQTTVKYVQWTFPCLFIGWTCLEKFIFILASPSRTLSATFPPPLRAAREWISIW